MPEQLDNPLDGRGIRIKPTWVELLPALLLIARDGETPEARSTGMAELTRMARAADAAGKFADALRPQLTAAARAQVDMLVEDLGDDPVVAAIEFLLSRQDEALSALRQAETA